MKAAASAAAGRNRTQQLLGYLPIGALILVALIVLKALKKVATSTDVMMQVTPDGRTIAVHVPSSMGRGASALPASTGQEEEWEDYEEVDPNEPEAAPVKMRRKKKRVEFEEDDDDDPVRVGRISEKVNVPLEQLKKMAGQKPDAIAMLLKSWLVEERR
jgi:flagellar biosynthesis/type III secretory pathway M-ring protein FliF/YscJ